MGFGVGQNVSRTIFGRENTVATNVRNLIQQGRPPTIMRAVVIEVIYDPKILTAEEKRYISSTVSNPDFVETMPQNTIIGRVITSGTDQTNSAPSVFYPFFSSHLMLPVQAGEQVSIIYEDYQGEGNSLGRWLDRVHENFNVEDVNYTHGDRRYDVTLNPANINAAQQANMANNNSERPRPSFPNGRNTPETYSLQQTDNENPYDQIWRKSKTAKQGTFEVVPRYMKRPSDLVLQGMNNSLIVLGQDRNATATRPEQESDSTDKKNRSGTIDLVVGRARFPLTENDDRTDAKPTSPLVINNTREYLEVDKATFLRNKNQNLQEGNPDLKNDAARIYITMNSVADTNFKLINDSSNGIDYPENTLNITQPSSPSNDVGNSYIINKADHIRLIARKKESDPEIKGTCMIIREGIKDDDLAYFYINEEGKIQIESKEVYIGKSTEKTEPYIKYTKFKEVTENLQSQIQDLENKLVEICNTLSTIFVTSMCQPGAPDQAVVNAGIQLIRMISPFNLSPKRQNVNNAKDQAKSEKIFGE